MFHLPATSARLTGVGVAGADAAVDDTVEEAMALSPVALSLFTQPARTVALRKSARLVVRNKVGIGAPVTVTNGPSLVMSSGSNVCLTEASCNYAICSGRPSTRRAVRR